MAITPDILSKELLVATEILRLEESAAAPVHFNLLVSSLQEQGLINSRATVSRALDMLFDQGMVKAEWVKRSDGRHVRQLKIAGEAREFIAGIARRVRSQS